MTQPRRISSIGMVSALAAGVLALAAAPSPSASADPVPVGWSALGTGIGDGRVFQIATASDGSLYVGGTFTAAGGQANTRNIAHWTGSAWEALAGGVTNSGPNSPFGGVYAVAATGSPDQVWIGGEFAAVNGSVQSRLARWQVGTGWVATPGVENTPEQWDGVEEIVAVAPDQVYVGGAFTARTSGNPDPALTGLTKYDGTALVTVGGGHLVGPPGDGIVNGMTTTSDGHLLVTGQFLGVGPSGSRTTVNRIAEWDPNSSTWTAVGGPTSGPDALVAAVADTSAGVVVGGLFTEVTNSGSAVTGTNKLAMWNGTSWVSIGDVAGLAVEEVRVIGDYLYVGGEFDAIDGVDASNIARVRISTLSTSPRWEALTAGCDNGVNGVVRSIVDAGSGDVYVGGGFTDAGGVVDADRIARYSPGAPDCTTLLPAPTNFTLAGISRASVKGVEGTLAYLAWDVPADAKYTKFRVTTRGRKFDNGKYDDTVKHGDLTCTTRENWCSIFFPFREAKPGMSGRRFQQVIYSVRGVSKLGKGEVATFGPLFMEPIRPPSAPRKVMAAGKWQEVKIQWRKPADAGGNGIVAYYMVRDSRNQVVCFVRANDFTDPRDRYDCRVQFTSRQSRSFTVEAVSFNGEASQPAISNEATPRNLEITSTSRSRPSISLGFGTRITVRGDAVGFESGEEIRAVMRIGNGGWQTISTVKLDRFSGSFSFEKKIGARDNRTPITVLVEQVDRKSCGRDESCGRSKETTIAAIS